MHGDVAIVAELNGALATTLAALVDAEPCEEADDGDGADDGSDTYACLCAVGQAAGRFVVVVDVVKTVCLRGPSGRAVPRAADLSTGLIVVAAPGAILTAILRRGTPFLDGG